MAFLATVLAYLGTAIGVTVALLMSLCALFSAPGALPSPHQTVAMAAKRSEPKIRPAVPATPVVSSGIGPQVAPAVPDSRPVPQYGSVASAHRTRTANVTSRDQYYHRPDRADRGKHWAYQLVPDFESRYMGYVNEPSADTSRIE